MLYRSIYSGPPRSYGKTATRKRYITIHNTSNSRDASAEDEASYAKNRTDGTSSHYYVDRDSIVQSLDTDLRANHAGSPEGNSAGIAYEITGTNSKTRAWWLANVAWDLLAAQIKADCAEHGITPRLLTVAEMKAGKSTGIITHDLARQVWGGTDHTDPGKNFPLDHLLHLLTEEDDMPLTKDDLNQLWNGDGVIKAPDSALKRDPKNTHWGASSILRYTYDAAVEGRAETRAVKLLAEATLKAVQGIDSGAIIAAVNARAAEDAKRDATLLAELQGLASGGATAQDILDQLAVRLSGAGE